MQNLPSFITNSSLAGVLAAVFSGGALATLLAFWTRYRGQSLNSEEQIRGYFERELTALRDKLDKQEQHFKGLEKHWREMLEASDRRHTECEDDRQKLRHELNEMHNQITGLQRQILSQGAERVLRLEQDCPPAPHSRAAAERVKKITDGDK